ncbi:YbhB and YbcL [Neisseria bacilliformis ATCC BAA-1200]|uniref:YbhB and YbcL n=1 Tax=Neisseria bacilliformis ATCC BAA-1200 TaxID=888742 RepID=F2BFP1_9NEIS|nr:YbhB and YbcL [Neisseria bacilliformis ATCC BAA-1200]
MDTLADSGFGAYFGGGKRQYFGHRLCAGREQLGKRAGQTQHRRSLPLRRHGTAQLPPRYELIVYALDTKLNLPKGFRFNDLHFAMQGHILASASVMGTYDA